MEINKQKLLEWIDKKADGKPFGAVYAALIEVFKEIQLGTFDSPSTQTDQDYEEMRNGQFIREIAMLQEANKLLEAERELWENRAADAKNDRDTFSREMHAFRRRAVQAEKERDIAVKALQGLAEDYPSIVVNEHAQYALMKLAEIRRSTDEATS